MFIKDNLWFFRLIFLYSKNLNTDESLRYNFEELFTNLQK